MWENGLNRIRLQSRVKQQALDHKYFFSLWGLAENLEMKKCSEEPSYSEDR